MDSSISIVIFIGVVINIIMIVKFFNLCSNVNKINNLLQQGIYVYSTPLEKKPKIIAKSIEDLKVGNKVIRAKDGVELEILNVLSSKTYAMPYLCKEANTNNDPKFYKFKDFKF